MEESPNIHTQPLREREKKIFDNIDHTLEEYDESERRRVDHLLASGGIAILGENGTADADSDTPQ